MLLIEKDITNIKLLNRKRHYKSNSAQMFAFVEHMKLIAGGKKYKWAHSEFGNLLAKHESNNNYNICNRTKGGYTVINNLVLSDYTIKEIQKKQKDRDVFAIGRYQLIPITLNSAIKSLNLDTSLVFDETLQDRIFEEYLIDKKRPKIIAYLEGNGNVEDAMYSAAKEWASVAVEKGKKISKNRIAEEGFSYYQGDGLNKAHISSESIKKALINSKLNN